MKKLAPENWFELHTQDMPRICIPSQVATENVVELLNEDCLSHPHTSHVFYIPRLMKHLCRKQLSKDADIFFTVNVGPYFWTYSMHEPLTMLIVLPLTHVTN